MGWRKKSQDFLLPFPERPCMSLVPLSQLLVVAENRQGLRGVDITADCMTSLCGLSGYFSSNEKSLFVHFCFLSSWWSMSRFLLQRRLGEF